jgi:hypothetical protein
MYHLPLPALDVAQVYPNCARRTRNQTLRNGLLSEGRRVIRRSLEYGDLASRSALHEMTEDASAFVSPGDLADLYDRVLVNGRERSVYNRIRGSSRFGRCALCAQRDVKTLDHHLPKAIFPEFSVLPMNLVPSCFECNGAKDVHVPRRFSEQTFHPYFDNWDSLELVRASIVIENTVFVEFHINSEGLPSDIAERAFTHFWKLDLATLYSEHASVELVQKREYFVLTFEDDGPEALRAELLRECQSRQRPFPNAWQPVLYRALASSDEFVSGGFYAIEDDA